MPQVSHRISLKFFIKCILRKQDSQNNIASLGNVRPADHCFKFEIYYLVKIIENKIESSRNLYKIKFEHYKTMLSMNNLKNLRVAIVHDWLTGMRGGEKVLEIFCQIFPEADIYTLIYNEGSISSVIASHKIHTSFIDKFPLKKSKYRHYLPLFPTAIERFNFKQYDLILSSSHCVAKGIITPPDAKHIAYLHTPMRYVWDMYEDYFGRDKVGFFGRLIIPYFANYLRMWDVTSSNRVDWFLANSQHVANRIRKYYGREAMVIHPPVETELLETSQEKRDSFLIVSALVPYKRIDLAVQVFNANGKSLTIVGEGPELNRLKKMAKGNIEFVEWQPGAELRKFYAKAKALVFPGEEDFGIVPVEAMANGTPVIAYGKGGALETVLGWDDLEATARTGVFFYQQTAEALSQAIDKLENIEWDYNLISQHAKKFDKEIFRDKIIRFIREKIVEGE
jgi:glycosyltransferase involved in cell wall biosynthesis